MSLQDLGDDPPSTRMHLPVLRFVGHQVRALDGRDLLYNELKVIICKTDRACFGIIAVPKLLSFLCSTFVQLRLLLS